MVSRVKLEDGATERLRRLERRERFPWKWIDQYWTNGRYVSGRRVLVNIRIMPWYFFIEVYKWALILGSPTKPPRGYRWQRRPGD